MNCCKEAVGVTKSYEHPTLHRLGLEVIGEREIENIEDKNMREDEKIHQSKAGENFISRVIKILHASRRVSLTIDTAILISLSSFI